MRCEAAGCSDGLTEPLGGSRARVQASRPGSPTCAPPDRAFESVPGACSRAPAVPRGRRPDEGVAPRGVVFHS